MTKITKLLKIFSLCHFFFFYWKSNAFAKIELNYSSPPLEIRSDQSFSLDVTLSGADPTAEYYLRGVFYKPDSTQYFGFTQNNLSSWQADPTPVTQFYKITGNGTSKISFKPDLGSPHFVPNSNYLFKIGRYTPAGSLTWSDQTPSSVLIKSVELTPSVSPTIVTASSTPVITATPTTHPSSPTPTATNVDPTAIVLSEIMACPNDSQGEWVELFNKTNTSLDLRNWKLKDTSDTRSIAVNTEIAPHGYVVIHLSSAILNNSGDSVRLFTDQNSLIDQMNYLDCSDGMSFILQDGRWQTTQSVTQGSVNMYSSASTPTPTITNSLTPTPEDEETSLDLDSISSSDYDSSLDVYFDDSLMASESSEASSESQFASFSESTSEAKVASSSPNNLNSRQPIFPASTAFLLGGCSYILSAAMLAQKWYNLTSYAVTAFSPPS